MKTLLIDVDNVLRDIHEPIIRLYNKDHKAKIKKNDIITWEMIDHMPKMTDSLQYYRNNPVEVLLNAPEENKHNIDILNQLSTDYKIHIVTHQLPGFEYFTIRWLKVHNVKYESISFTRHKQDVKGDLFLDDRVLNLTMYEKFNPNAVVVAYDQPWNKDYYGNRIKDFRDLKRYL